MTCLLYNLVLWQQHFYYISAGKMASHPLLKQNSRSFIAAATPNAHSGPLNSRNTLAQMQLVLQSVINNRQIGKLCHLAALLQHTCSCLDGSPLCQPECASQHVTPASSACRGSNYSRSEGGMAHVVAPIWRSHAT